MVVEGGLIDEGGRKNDTEYVVHETLGFDIAIDKALEFGSSNRETLVIVTSDHETGGMALTDGDINKNKIVGDFVTKSHTGVMVPVFAYGEVLRLIAGFIKMQIFSIK